MFTWTQIVHYHTTIGLDSRSTRKGFFLKETSKIYKLSRLIRTFNKMPLRSKGDNWHTRFLPAMMKHT